MACKNKGFRMGIKLTIEAFFAVVSICFLTGCDYNLLSHLPLPFSELPGFWTVTWGTESFKLNIITNFMIIHIYS